MTTEKFMSFFVAAAILAVITFALLVWSAITDALGR
jgi:hypothetical protein